MQVFSLQMNGQTVGKVELNRQGLFYELTCRCVQIPDEKYRLIARGNAGEVSLGRLLREKQEYYLHTRFPVKRIGEEGISFSMQRNDSGTSIPIHEDQPIECLAMLEQCCLDIRNSQHYLVFSPGSAPQDNDRSPLSGNG